jgi:hypothetical protein
MGMPMMELKNATRGVLGYGETVVNFDPLEDASTIPEMLTYLRDSDHIEQLGGQAQLWFSRMFNAWVVSWTRKGDLYGSMEKGQTINEALCRAVCAVGSKEN